MSKSDWIRANRRAKCPVCGKPDWCLIAKDLKAVICSRMQDGCDRVIGEAGFLHVLEKRELRKKIHPWLRRSLPLPPYDRATPTPEAAPINFDRIALFHERSATSERLSACSKQLGVSTESLQRLNAGWATTGGWTFPMRNQRGEIIGIRYRADSGRKWAQPGSRNGLFIPHGLTGKSGLMVICEGPTDTAAMLDLGYDVIGRPMCRGGEDMIEAIVAGYKVAIFADDDGVGYHGAYTLANALWHKCPEVKVVTPPFKKDAREWVEGGATRSAVDSVLDCACVWSLMKSGHAT